MEEGYDVSSESIQRLPQNDQRLPYNRLQLQDKIIEPENDIKDRPFNRNLQLGFITKQDHAILTHKINISDMLKGIPNSQGGFFFTQVGDLLQAQVHTSLIMSNSVNGRGRQGLFTSVSRQEFRDSSASPRFGGFGQTRREE